MRVAGDALRPFRERFLHDLGGRGNTWIWHNQTRGATTTLKWRGECANGMDERCEANLLIASVRPAVGRAVLIIRGTRDFSLEEGYFIPIIHDFLDAVGVSLLRRRPPPPWGWSGLSFSFFDPHGLPLFFADPLDITI